MAGTIPERAEVAWRTDDALSEVMLPKPVHPDAGDMQITRIPKPGCELSAAGPRRHLWRLGWGDKQCRNSTRDKVAKVIVLAAVMDTDIVDASVRALGNAALLRANGKEETDHGNRLLQAAALLEG